MDPHSESAAYSFDQEPKNVRVDKKAPLDWVSIVLSIVALALIGLGVFFLSQTFKLGGGAASSSSSVSKSAPVSLPALFPSPASNSLSSASVSSSAASSASIVSSSASSSSAASIPVAPVFDPKTAALKTGSTNAEIKVTITSVSGGLVGASVTETGFANTRWFSKSGVFWNAFDAASFSPTPKVGEVWRLELTVTSSQENGALLTPGAIVVAKAYKL